MGKAEGAGKGREGLTEAPRRSEPWRIIYDPPLKESEREVGELINRRRRQIAVHSFLYYHLNESIITDHLFDKWSKELVDLQVKHPDISEKVTYQRNYFRGWDGSSGYDLPVDEYAVSNAHRLLRYTHA